MSELGISLLDLFLVIVYVAGSVISGIAGLQLFHRFVKPLMERPRK